MNTIEELDNLLESVFQSLKEDSRIFKIAKIKKAISYKKRQLKEAISKKDKNYRRSENIKELNRDATSINDVSQDREISAKHNHENSISEVKKLEAEIAKLEDALKAIS